MPSANFLNAFAAYTDPTLTASSFATTTVVGTGVSNSTTSYVPATTSSQAITASSLSGSTPSSSITTLHTAADGTQYTVDANGFLIPDAAGSPITVTGSGTTAATSTTATATATSTSTSATSASSSVDARLRISALPSQETKIYGANGPTNILAPLYATGGLMFPYTPSISVQGESNWTPNNLVHTNFDILSYEKTPSATIGLAGKFTVQNQREGQYVMAVIHFLRVVTKMHFGDQDSAQNNATANAGKGSLAGLPPPVLRLRGYGNFMFNDLRCVVRGYSFNFDEQMDLVPVTSAGGTMYLPALFTLNVNIGLQQSPRKVRKDFNLDQFRTGALLTGKGGYWF